LGGRRWRRERNLPEEAIPDDEKFLQSITDVRHLLSGEWVWDVLVALRSSSAQYTELLSVIQEGAAVDRWPGVKHRRLRDGTLNRTLRRLERGELVERNREPEFPYRTTYQLTEPARELMDATVPVVCWADKHQALVERARARRKAEDSREG
jgi:DNA-binding HxlR family transcriptional regulator